jgi:hypothetical protein
MTSFTTIAGTAGRITGHAARLTLQGARHARRLAEQIDWQEVATIVVLGIVTAVALTWEAGFRTGRFIHDLNDALAREWVAALGVLERPAATIKESLTVAGTAQPVAAKPVRRPHPQPTPQPVPAMTPAPVVATWAVPLDRAVSAVRCGQASQRQAAKRYGISRTSLQRALAAA